MMGYYDLVLGLIPFGLGSIATTLYLFGLEVTVAVPIASLFAVFLIGHAMFVRAPVDTAIPADGQSRTTQTDAVFHAD